MQSESVKLAKVKAQSDLIKDLIKNPVLELLAGIIAISYLNKGSQSWFESTTGIDLAAGGEYAGLVTIIGLQQLAPLIPSIVAGGSDITKALPSLLPLLAMGAAA
jgi:hypothetical protein